MGARQAISRARRAFVAASIIGTLALAATYGGILGARAVVALLGEPLAYSGAIVGVLVFAAVFVIDWTLE